MSCLIDGDPTADILIVGMAPGREELLEDRPFIGGSGRVLWAVARRAGWGRENAYIINTIGEAPAGRDGNPTDEQYGRYWARVDDALGSFRGRVALLLGRAALERITGLKGGIEAWRGYLVAPGESQVLTYTRRVTVPYKTANKTRGIKKGDPREVVEKVHLPAVVPPNLEYYIPTLHPAALMRTGFRSIPAFSADLARVRRALDGELRESRSEYVNHAVLTTDTLPVAFDIETDGDISRIGIAHAVRTWTLPWGKSAGEAARIELSRPERVKIAHNIAFDLPHLAAAGVEVTPPIWDTMLAAAMLQPDLYKGLNAVASLYLDRPRWKHEATRLPEFYNATDASVTLELYHVLRAELERTQQLKLFEGTIMPTIPTLINMTRRGIRVDEMRRVKWQRELRWRETRAAVGWMSIVPDLQPSQNIAIARLLYDQWKLPEQVNKYGGRTADVGAIRYLMTLATGEQKLALEHLLEYREVNKLRTTYAQHPLSDTGCVHPSYLPAAKDTEGLRKGMAATGRPTASDPNIQNQPQEARKMYVPHEPGMVLVAADFSQIELRIAGALAQDDALQQALTGDVHAHTQKLLGCDRTRAKNVIYGSLYGAGPRKLANLLKLRGIETSEKECKQLQQALANAYPRLWQWRQEVVRDAGTHYYLSNPFGRRRYFYGGRSEAPAAIDFLPQSTAADIMWRVLQPLGEEFERCGGAILATIHDEVLGESPQGRLRHVALRMKEVMTQEWPEVAQGFRVPITIKTGSNWGEMRPYETSKIVAVE